MKSGGGGGLLLLLAGGAQEFTERCSQLNLSACSHLPPSQLQCSTNAKTNTVTDTNTKSMPGQSVANSVPIALQFTIGDAIYILQCRAESKGNSHSQKFS